MCVCAVGGGRLPPQLLKRLSSDQVIVCGVSAAEVFRRWLGARCCWMLPGEPATLPGRNVAAAALRRLEELGDDGGGRGEGSRWRGMKVDGGFGGEGRGWRCACVCVCVRCFSWDVLWTLTGAKQHLDHISVCLEVYCIFNHNFNIQRRLGGWWAVPGNLHGDHSTHLQTTV